MKLNLGTANFFALFASVALCSSAVAGCAADTDQSSDDAAEEMVEQSDSDLTGASNSGFFVVTRQVGEGFFVKRVNQVKTVCGDGSSQPECYVSALTMTGIGLSAREEQEARASLVNGSALVKAATYKKTIAGKIVSTLKASQVWVGATGSAPSGSFYRVADNGIRCITAPCPTTTAYQLNGHDDHNVLTTHLESTASLAKPADLDLAQQALTTKDGILVAGGIAIPKCVAGSTTCGPMVMAQEFYLRVVAREGKGCGGRGSSSCNAGQFCSWKATDICGAFDAGGVCSYRPQMCPQIYLPVCACDGQTYSSACHAAAAGASVSSLGACKD
ncbi:MAG: hypothetical protein JWP97_1624 [Labilithrix sp.]|nr:hypothetical protein [Labilithrix sp.]